MIGHFIEKIEKLKNRKVEIKRTNRSYSLLVMHTKINTYAMNLMVCKVLEMIVFVQRRKGLIGNGTTRSVV